MTITDWEKIIRDKGKQYFLNDKLWLVAPEDLVEAIQAKHQEEIEKIEEQLYYWKGMANRYNEQAEAYSLECHEMKKKIEKIEHNHK